MDRFDNEMPDRAKSVTKRLTTIMSGNNNLFNIIGGPVKIIEIIGIVVVDSKKRSMLDKQPRCPCNRRSECGRDRIEYFQCRAYLWSGWVRLNARKRIAVDIK